VLFTLENMSEEGQAMALPLIEGIKTRGATDIFTAITEALNIIELREDKSRNPAIMMFTDGVPNRSPPEGEVKAISNILETKKMACPIHTFGFGYNLDSNKLYDIA
jgi:Mg-chelatase subunit ChlD